MFVRIEYLKKLLKLVSDSVSIFCKSEVLTGTNADCENLLADFTLLGKLVVQEQVVLNIFARVFGKALLMTILLAIKKALFSKFEIRTRLANFTLEINY